LISKHEIVMKRRDLKTQQQPCLLYWRLYSCSHRILRCENGEML